MNNAKNSIYYFQVRGVVHWLQQQHTTPSKLGRNTILDIAYNAIDNLKCEGVESLYTLKLAALSILERAKKMLDYPEQTYFFTDLLEELDMLVDN